MKSHTGQSLFPRLSIQSKQAAVIFSKYIFACTINLFRNHTFPFKPVTKESRVGAYLCFVLTLHKQRITCPHEKISPVLRQGLAQGHKKLIHISYGVLSSFFMSHSWKMPVPCKQTTTHHKYISRGYIYAGEKIGQGTGKGTVLQSTTYVHQALSFSKQGATIQAGHSLWTILVPWPLLGGSWDSAMSSWPKPCQEVTSGAVTHHCPCPCPPAGTLPRALEIHHKCLLCGEHLSDFWQTIESFSSLLIHIMDNEPWSISQQWQEDSAFSSLDRNGNACEYSSCKPVWVYVIGFDSVILTESKY